MTKRREYDMPVPLFLIGAAITRGVKLRGGKLFRISVVRTHSHHYLIKYKCRARDAENAPDIDTTALMVIDPEQCPDLNGRADDDG
jgi:hypothetical protein